MENTLRPTVWKIGGPAGFGIMTTGLLMSKLATRQGKQIFDYAEYPSLVQGGHNTYEVMMHASSAKARCMPVDILACLTPDTAELHKERLHEKSLILHDEKDQISVPTGTTVSVPITDIIAELKASKIMGNMVMFGASAAILGSSKEAVTSCITAQFGSKGEDVVSQNTACAHAGFDHITTTAQDHCLTTLSDSSPATEAATPKAILTGNDAFSLAAIAANCTFYAAYPMTPSSSVLSTLAAFAPKAGMIVRHAEDEIGVVSEALGASFAGARAAVGTSGGGFALMTESVSYAGVAEIPLVIFMSQRPGPATGMPTWTEQGDLLFTVHAGHGEFPKIVLAPGTIQEMIELTQHAFNLADIYQTPVILLSDKYLSESHYSLPVSEVEKLCSKPQDRGETTTTATSNYLRYAITDSGISPRLLPGVEGSFYQANSYEHIEDSHTSEEAEARVAQVDKRARKTKTYLAKHWLPPKVFGSLADAKVTLVSWGSHQLVVEAAREMLAYEKISVAHIHFSSVYPLAADQITPLFEGTTPVVVVENNSTGQFAKLLHTEAGIVSEEPILKYDGRPFYPEEIVAAVKERYAK